MCSLVSLTRGDISAQNTGGFLSVPLPRFPPPLALIAPGPSLLFFRSLLSPQTIVMGAFVDRFRPKRFPRRYPQWMVGRRLLIASSALASLGDAMFGYSQGVIAALQVQPPFIRRFFGKDVTLEQINAGTTGVDPWVQCEFCPAFSTSSLTTFP